MKILLAATLTSLVILVLLNTLSGYATLPSQPNTLQTYPSTGNKLEPENDQTGQNTRNIPIWIKNTARWWHDGFLGDADFTNGIQYLIQQKIIHASQPTSGYHSGNIPAWIKNLAGMWVSNQITDFDFLDAMEYLVRVGIIQVGVTSNQNNTQNPTTSAPIPIQTITNTMTATTINNTNSLSSLNSTTSSGNLSTNSLLGLGINLKIINNTASGVLTLDGKPYNASNLTANITEDNITLMGYIKGSFNFLMMANGVHTTGIEYKFDGSLTNNTKSEPITFTALLVNPVGQTSENTKLQSNIPSNTTTPQAPGLTMLILTSHNYQVYMAYQYKFVVKIFDPQYNPQKIFDQFNGGISDVNISVTILDPNNEMIGKSSGKTDRNGIYPVGILMPYTEYAQEHLQVMINATKEGYVTQTANFPILLIHP